MREFILRLFFAVLFTSLFLGGIMPFLYVLILGISYRLLEKIEMWNECVKESDSFLKGLRYFVCVFLCGIALVVFTGLLRLIEKIDVFHMLDSMKDEECA